MKFKSIVFLCVLSLICAFNFSVYGATTRPVAKKILIFGDSMTGWLGERLEAYGKQNGFEVATIVWDGSTFKKWANSKNLATTIKNEKPDAVFICLGMNDLFVTKPDTQLGGYLDTIKKTIGNVPIVWLGPPSWPGYNQGEVLNQWLAEKMGNGHFYRAFDLKIPRQSAKNPHPTRAGINTWMDNVVEWIKTDGAIQLPGYAKPTGAQTARGKTYIYKRMKESF